jgi:thiol-disulfide isomerase/thioredoxin
MRRAFLFLLIFIFSFLYLFSCDVCLAQEKLKIKLFYSSNCKHCIEIREKFLPEVLLKYGKDIEIEYLNISNEDDFKLFLALEEKLKIKARVPAVLLGGHFLIGSSQIKDNLESLFKKYIQNQQGIKIQIGKIDLLEKFKSFSALAVISAGLIDGINPCAFTVLIFFISFLTLMGYKKQDLAIIGLSFISAVFFTYLAIGLGVFKGFYQLKHFYILLKSTYFGLALLCFVMAYLNLRDFFIYKKTKSTDALKVKLPKSVRSRINAIIGKYYRKDSGLKAKGKIGLMFSTFVVGFLISLLEAVCTGQVYLPTIVFILKEPGLRIRAVFYLILYNFMFVAPLLLILLLAIFGVSSNKLGEFFKQRMALVKVLMFILFIGLGLFLLIGV